MQRQITISGTQEVEVHLLYTTQSSLAIYIRYAMLGSSPCNVPYSPCLVTARNTTNGRIYSGYICTNCDTLLLPHLPHGMYRIVAVIEGTRYCTSYSHNSTSRIMLHALPIADSCSQRCNYCCNCDDYCHHR